MKNIPFIKKILLSSFAILFFHFGAKSSNILSHPEDSIKVIVDSAFFKETPLCLDPTGVAGFWETTNKSLIVSWTGVEAASNYSRYRIRYKLTSGSAYSYSMAYSGRSSRTNLMGLTVTKPLNIAIQKICDGDLNTWTLESDWVNVTATDINTDSTDYCSILQVSSATNNTANVVIQMDANSTKPSLPSGMSYGYRIKDCGKGTWIGPYTFTGESYTVPTNIIAPGDACVVEVNIYQGGAAVCSPIEIIMTNPADLIACTAPTFDTETSFLSSLPIGTIVYMNGVPITVAEVTSSSGGLFTGGGFAIVPVKSASLAVSFTSIQVTAKGHNVTQGSAEGVSSSTRIIPIIAPITATICVPPPPADSLGLDENGFNPDGSYGVVPPYPGYQPPMDFDPGFDPRGFDANGLNRNGSLYDEFGCNQQGKDSSGVECDTSVYKKPYFWINPEETSEGQAFILQNGNLIKTLIKAYLNALYISYSDSVNAQTTICGGFRTTLNTNLTNLGLDDNSLVKGTSDIYVNDGMSNKFTSEPKPLTNASPDRLTAATALEQAHVDLYHCDKKLELFKHIKTWANKYKTTDSVEIFEEIFKIIKVKSIKELDSLLLNSNALLKELIKNSSNDLINTKVSHDVGYEDKGDQQEAKQLFDNIFNKNYKSTIHSGLCSIEYLDKNKIPKTAHSLYNKEDKKFGLLFSPPDASCEPLEIIGESGGLINTLLINNVRMNPTSCLFDVYMVMRIPSSGKDIMFKALDVGFNGSGPIVGSLGLGSDVEIKLTNAMKLILKTGTAVNFNCHGFRDVTVVAEVAVCREYLTPLDINNKPIPGDSILVKGYINQLTIKNWSNLFASISFDKFCVTDYPQFNFEVQEAEFDFSDTHSPSNVTVPNGYASSYYINGSFAPQWRGVYIKSIKVAYTSDMSTSASSVTLDAYNMIFDGMGFSGNMQVTVNQATLENTTMGGWPFSIDTIQMSFVANHLVSGGFSGAIVMSIAAKDSADNNLQKNALRYKAAMAKGGDFLLSVTSHKELEVGLWVAKMTLTRMQITAKRENEEFTFIASMDGKMRIGALDSTSTGKSFGAKFTNLIVSNKAPFLSAGTWNFDTASLGFTFKGFGLKLYNPGIYSPEPGRITIGINAAIELVGDKLDISAGARVLFKGKMIHPPGGRQRWVIDKIAVDSISLDADINDCAHVKGVIIFADNHAVYGDGFYGFAQLTIKKFDFIVNSAAQFGRKTDGAETYKYFFVDAFVKLPPEAAIPIMGMDLRGMGGGLFYNMQRVNAPTVLATTENPAVGFGMSLSGIQYVPAKGFMEFKAAVLLTAKSNEEHLSINAELAFAFKIGNGISLERIYFNGTARLMSKPDDQASITKTNDMPILGNAKFVANVELKFDFENFSLTGKLDMYLNADFIKGGNGGNYVGQIALKFSKDSNYIYVGTPQKPLAILVDVGGILQVKGKLYFDIGKPIPSGAMVIPEWADKLFNTSGVSVFNSKYSGPGVKFGIQIELNAEFNWSIVHGKLDILLGGDMEIMRNVDTSGLPISCSNTGEVIGINGWYARGRAYIAIQGTLKLKFRRWNVELAGFSLGAMLQAAGPNPFFATVSGSVKGSVCGFGFTKTFKATVGEQCVTDQQLDLTPDDLITRISPSPNQLDVNIVSNIEVDFNLPIGHQFVVSDDDGNEVTLQPKVNSYSLKTESGVSISLQEKWNESMDQLLLIPDYMPSNSKLIFKIEAKINDLTNPINSETFIKELSFTTGSFNNVSLMDVIESTYPEQGLEAFYRKDGAKKGYIKLSKNIGGTIFNNESDEEGYKFVVILQRSGTSPIILPYEYNYSTSMLEFGLPTALLVKGEIHKITLGKIKPSESNNINNPIQETYSAAQGELTGYNPNPMGNTSPAPTVELPSKWKYEIYFRVSKYEHMSEKLNAFISKVDTANVSSTDCSFTINVDNLTEPFFERELKNYKFSCELATSDQKTMYAGFITLNNCMGSSITAPTVNWGGRELSKPISYFYFTTPDGVVDESAFSNPSSFASSVNFRNDVTIDYLFYMRKFIINTKEFVTTIPNNFSGYYQYRDYCEPAMTSNTIYANPNLIKLAPLLINIEIKEYGTLTRSFNSN